MEVVDTAVATPAGAPVGGAIGAGASPGAGGGSGSGSGSGSGATAQFLSRRFPRLAALLPVERAGECFWLAAWWAAQAHEAEPPGWLPGALLSERAVLAAAAEAAIGDLGARAELTELDARIGPESLLGDQVGAALRLSVRPAAEVADVLAGERLLRHPLRLAAADLARRVAGDWSLSERLPDLDDGSWRPPTPWWGRASWRRSASCPARRPPSRRARAAVAVLFLPRPGGGDLSLVLGAGARSPQPGRARPHRALLAPGRGPGGRSARRRSDTGRRRRRLRQARRTGFPGCLRHLGGRGSGGGAVAACPRRVAVLVVDAMRVDVWSRSGRRSAEALPGRPLREAWAVVPEPTRTRESIAALYLGRPVAAGSGPDEPADLGPPFAHLGFEAAALVGVDRDGSAAARRDRGDRIAGDAAGPTRIVVAVATGVDEALHRSSADVASLVEEAVAGLERRVVPTLHALLADVPLVVLAHHGSRENRSWGRGSASPYVDGGSVT